jgi:signal transduction histidine kinase
MNTTKFPTPNRLFRTPFITAVFATLVSLIFAALINFLFLSPNSLALTLGITLVIAAPMSYLTIRGAVSLRETIESQKIKLALEHERAEILSKFMRDAAHEFKTPLTLMSSNLYLLERTSDPAKKQHYIQHTNEQIQILNSLLDTILILTRLDGTLKPDYQRVPAKAVELVSDIQSFNSISRIKMLVENADSLPSVQINLSDVHLALKQIIENALRFSPVTGDITVQITSSGQWLILDISDQGPGMSQETMQHIFDRFYRIDESHTTRGLGLGLAIAKRVFELHDGHIEVQSELGIGTTFKAFLPVSSAK